MAYRSTGIFVTGVRSLNPVCAYWGHAWHWTAGAVSCKRHGCHETSAKRTKAFLENFTDIEAHALIARELRHVEGFTTDDDTTGAW